MGYPYAGTLLAGTGGSVVKLQQQGGPGDILVFLTGRDEIDRCLSELADLLPE